MRSLVVALVVWLLGQTFSKFDVVFAGQAQGKKAEASPADIVIYASQLTEDDLSEFDFWDDASSPGGKLVGIRNTGDELDPPPENDPQVTFKVKVQRGVSYRCWIHMKVGLPKGKSQANKVWVQFTEAVNKQNNEILKPGTGSYLTAHGPMQPGWAWVACDFEGRKPSDSYVSFRVDGEITVLIQAGMEGVGLDQFMLSPAKYLDKSPTETVIKKTSNN